MVFLGVMSHVSFPDFAPIGKSEQEISPAKAGIPTAGRSKTTSLGGTKKKLWRQNGYPKTPRKLAGLKMAA